MKKDYAPFIIGLIVCFGLGFLAAGLYYSGKGGTTWGKAYAVSDVMGSSVKSPQGEEFGKIEDFVFDTNGRVAFGVISYGEKKVAIPFSGLKYEHETKHFVLGTTKERLDSAQAFDKSMLENRESVEGIYRHFGQSPFWTEASSEIMQDFPMRSPASEYTGP
jgi:hypothetical protein